MLVKPSPPLVTANDILWEETLRPCIVGVGSPGVFGCDAVTFGPSVAMSTGLRDFLRAGSLPSPEPGRVLLDVFVLPETVALRLSFCAAGSASDITSSTGRGLLA